MFDTPQWPVPSHIVAGFTHRLQGESQAPYDAFNIGLHVGDDAHQVERNRLLLDASLPGEKQWQWLDQVHGVNVVDAQGPTVKSADACYSNQALQVCAVMTADCLPILLASQDGQEVAAIHAGWRSLCHGIIEQTLQRFAAPSSTILAYLGPAIGPQYFEVGEDVRQAFLAENCGEQSIAAFCLQDNQRYLADLYQLACIRLHSVGVQAIYGGSYCTYSQPERFYSYRREGVTGRMVSFIYRMQ